jgi:hypothetical protein
MVCQAAKWKGRFKAFSRQLSAVSFQPSAISHPFLQQVRVILSAAKDPQL